MISKSTVKKFCCEDISKIENYEEAIDDKSQTWHCHHRFETHNSDGERRLIDITKKELISLDMYYDRPANELIFMTNSEHITLHQKGRKLSEETRKKIAVARKGIQLSEETKRKISEEQKGKKRLPFSEETRKKMSEAAKGKPGTMKGKHHSEETRKKISEANKGKKHKPLSEETKRKISLVRKDKHWKLIDGHRVWY